MSAFEFKKIAVCFIAFAGLVVASLSAPPANAQVVGATLSGTVTDQSGALLSGTHLSIRNLATNVLTDATTNVDGFYSVPNLLPGTYDVTVSTPGFATEVRRGVTLTVGAQQVLNLSLRVGAVSEQVVVSGETPSIELGSSSISAEIDPKTVVELPLNGRDWTLLAALEPGVNTIATQANLGTSGSRGNRGFGTEVTVAGTRPQTNNYRTDGVSVVDYSGGAPGSVSGFALGVDAIAEFSVITSNHSAEYGRTSGGVINAITRSGSNGFHGNAYGFLRSASLDARNFFDGPTIPPFHRSQFGGSVGGPIRKDKTFFFVDYEAIREGIGTTNVDTVPSEDARNGTLHNADGSTTTVPVDPITQEYLQFWPLPNNGLIGTGNTGTFKISTNETVHENFVTTKIDHTFSEVDKISGTYLYGSGLNAAPDVLNNVYVANSSSRQLVAIEETHTFTPSLTNSARIGYSRVVAGTNNNPTAINPLAAEPGLGAFPGSPAAASVVVAGLTTFGGGIFGVSSQTHYWNAYQVYDDAFLVKGAHSIKFGFGFERDQHNIYTANNINGRFNFSSLQNFLTNVPSTFTGSSLSGYSVFGLRQSIVGAYVQDDWRIRTNLTLNLGVRYEMATVPTEVKDKLENLRTLTSPNLNIGSPLFNNPSLRNFAPRVGLAWDPFHNGKTAVRAAFGMFDILPYIYTYYTSGIGTAPFAQLVTVGGLQPGSFPYGLADASSTPNQLQVAYMEFNPHRNYMMTWNLNIQQQITPSLTAMVGYIGNHGVHMLNRQSDMDTVIPTETAAGLLFPFPAGSGTKVNPTWGDIRGEYWGGTSLYDALVTSLTKKFSHGFQGQISYTWGKGIDTGSTSVIDDAFTNSISSPYFFWPGRRALSDYNIAHTLIINYIWDIPTPKNWGGVPEAVLGGWEVGGIFTAQTGQPFTPKISGDPLGTLSSDPWAYPDRVNAPGCDNPVNPGNPNHYLKLACFTLPSMPVNAPPSLLAQCTPFAAAPGTCQNLLGNLGRNSVIGPGLVNLNFSLFKNVPIPRVSETFTLQFRTEIFNIFNRADFQIPLSNLSVFNATGAPVAGAGAINATTYPSRQIQFGLKVIF
jgi:Carboxypeptidase regulatory-like domain/TonB dependent receptor/TonB-dependent Receptor Plug Domain